MAAKIKKALGRQGNFSEPAAGDPGQCVPDDGRGPAASGQQKTSWRYRHGSAGCSSGTWQRVKIILPVGRSCRSGRKAADFSGNAAGIKNRLPEMAVRAFKKARDI